MRFSFASAAFVAMACLVAAPAAAELQPEDASLVPLFLETCTTPDMSDVAIFGGVATSTDWTESQTISVDLEAIEQVPSRLTGGTFSRAESVREWHRTVNGRELVLVIASFPERSRYRHGCVLFAPDIRNALPYLEPFREGMRSIGLSGRSTDLPHFQEYGGRLADGRRAHADIFSRSRASSVPHTMQLAIIYE